MQPAQDTNTEHQEDTEGGSTDVAAAAVAQIAAHELKQSQQRAEAAMLSPLDQALRRNNTRPAAKAPSIWDAEKPMQAPSVSLDPQNITGDEHYVEEEHAALLGGVVNAMQAMHDAVAKTIAAREAVKQDPTMTPAAQVLAVDTLNSKLWPAATQKVDQQLAHLESCIATVHAELRAPIKATNATAIAGEIRAYVRGLKAADRQTLLVSAIDNGDAVTAGAVLGGTPAYLSGLEPQMVEALTNQWNVARNPQAARRLAVLQSAKTKLDRASSLFIYNLENAVGARNETVRRLREQQQATRRVTGAIA